MKKYIYFIFLLSVSQIVKGQSDAYFSLTLYINNYSLINPAYTGIESKQKFTYHGRVIGLYKENIGSTTQNLSFEGRATKINSAIGVSFLSDNLWGINSYYKSLSYAYEFKIKDSSQSLRLGVQPSLLTQKSNYYGIYDSQNLDILVGDFMNEKYNYFYLKYGIWYKFNKINLSYSSDIRRGIGENSYYLDYNNKRHNIYLYAGLNSYKVLKGLKATHNIVLNYVTYGNNINSILNLDLFTGFEIRNIFNVGLMYRSFYLGQGTNSKLILSSGINIRKKINLNVVIYNLSKNSSIDSFNGELMLKFLL